MKQLMYQVRNQVRWQVADQTNFKWTDQARAQVVAQICDWKDHDDIAGDYVGFHVWEHIRIAG